MKRDPRTFKKIFGSKRLAVATLLGTIAFASTCFLPTPIDKMFIVIQALAFALGSLIIAKGGAMYTALTNGVLLSILRTGFFPFSLVFSLIYGLLIDASFQAFRVRKRDHLRRRRLVAALTLSTMITGLVSMYLTTLMGLMPAAPIVYAAILGIGILNGVIAAYLTLLIWNKYLVRAQ